MNGTKRWAIGIVALGLTLGVPAAAHAQQVVHEGKEPVPLAGTGVREGTDYGGPMASETPYAEQGEMRSFTLELNPLSFFVGQYGASIEVLPARHHALILTGYYYAWKTDPDATFARTNLLQGVGGEIGYRYYSSPNGPRGFFVGPSLLGSWIHSKTSDTESSPVPGPDVKTSFESFGLAIDFGYQAVVADDVVIGIGAGAQYRYATRDNPDQEWPASVQANRKVYPRALFALGWAF